MRLSAPSALIVLVLASAPARAGGWDEPARVVSIERSFFTQFRLVLDRRPADAADAEPIFRCARLTVLGHFAPYGLLRRFPDEVTRKSHRAALARLEAAAQSGAPVRFGAMGRGLAPAPEEGPCVARSRALVLLDDPAGTVISYYARP